MVAIPFTADMSEVTVIQAVQGLTAHLHHKCLMSHPTVLPHQTIAGRAEMLEEVDVPPVSIQPALYGALSVVSIRRTFRNQDIPSINI